METILQINDLSAKQSILNGLQTVEEASECWNTGVLIKSKEKMQETQ